MKGISLFATIGLVTVIGNFTEIVRSSRILMLMNASLMLLCVIGVATLDIKRRKNGII